MSFCVMLFCSRMDRIRSERIMSCLLRIQDLRGPGEGRNGCSVFSPVGALPGSLALRPLPGHCALRLCAAIVTLDRSLAVDNNMNKIMRQPTKTRVTAKGNSMEASGRHRIVWLRTDS